MGSAADKAKGLGNEAIGNIKQGLGKVADNAKLQGEGVAQERKGEAQQAKADLKNGVKKVVDKI